ncbi:hypothetical protein BCR41DRAFT_353938 [Lobosporangium transversale]|uniref:Uncharacterized protein n=1 Tax=Lobosporangium transversale TaxID=64571 RepID=A0A1Y2GPR3_9FUNG|nr:hypothetical protein BCR41DRAFT_353938 [Lobosporangium transversale]ORZ15513.1 hypothetical protein BCR41DRAFT_353938 [Lobosporangium transversale]|eukprot:XP_021881261.1 hypothetical protein BCR41DRAFT_353938 [Lobosporangium transversale]
MCKREKQYFTNDHRHNPKAKPLQIITMHAVLPGPNEAARAEFEFLNMTKSEQRITFEFQIGPRPSNLRRLGVISVGPEREESNNVDLSMEEILEFISSGFHSRCRMEVNNPINGWVDFEIAEVNRRDLGQEECARGCISIARDHKREYLRGQYILRQSATGARCGAMNP